MLQSFLKFFIREKSIKVIFFLMLLFATNVIMAHGVQVAYCVTNNGTVRVYIEHWHGNITAEQTADGAQVQIIVDDGTTVVDQFFPAQGAIVDTAIDDLPDCKESIVSLTGCTNASSGRNMNTQNDWVYWEFLAPACGLPLSITVNSVQGSQSFYFDEGCTNLYPASFTATFEDCAPPVINCTANLLTQVDAGGCTANVTSGVEPEILFDDCTAVEDLIVTHDITGATVRSGSGIANGIFNKGTSTVTYTVEDEVGGISVCSFDVIVEDNGEPLLVCPATLLLECGDVNNDNLINNWLATFSAMDGCGIASEVNSYNPANFASAEDEQSSNPFLGPYNYTHMNIGMASFSLLSNENFLDISSEYAQSSTLSIKEMSGKNLYDIVVQAKVDYREGMSRDYNDLLITDSENRVIPYWVESYNDENAVVWMKVPELTANKVSDFNIAYDSALVNEFDPEDIFSQVSRNVNDIETIHQNNTRMLVKMIPADEKNKLYMQSEESAYQFSLAARPSGNVSIELARMKEKELPMPLYLEGNMTSGEAFFFDYKRNDKDYTTQHAIRNDLGLNVISDKFIDDSFNTLESINVEKPENIEFVAVFSSPEIEPLVSGDLFSSMPKVPLRDKEIFERKESANYINKQMMGCDCVASQGTQSFNINAIQNAEDDVAFYSYNVPDAASANTGLEMNDAVVLFLYENTLTGEISLFIIIDAVRGGNGGNGSIDFFCLSSSATLDFSDDPGEITGIFPTVTANWRWANCCTDGALIGNVGCNSTFDFFPNFPNGINQMKWASGTLANPTFTVFNSSTEPVRITCGDAQPECCPNANIINLTDATCPTSNEGAVDLITDPAGAPYTFAWSNGATTEDISNLLPGIYTVTITDVNNCTQIIDNEIGVTERPTITCPTDITIQMTGTMATVDLSDLNFTVNYNCPDAITETCFGCGDFACADQNMVQFVTVQIEDVIGNNDECNINVFIENLSPNVTCPSDLLLECADTNNENLISSWLTTMTAADDGSVTLDNSYNPGSFAFNSDENETTGFTKKVSGKQSIEDGPKDFYFVIESIRKTEATLAASKRMASAASFLPGPVKGTQVVTFTATDECGNSSSCTATIIIDDTTPPSISCPNDITVECGDPNTSAIITTWLGTAVYFDECNGDGSISNSYAANPVGGCSGNTGSEIVTFTADDGCGNTSVCTATVTIDDTQSPDLVLDPRDLMIDCDSNVTDNIDNWVSLNGFGVAEDDCSNAVIWTATPGAQVDLCGATFTQDYTFVVTDECGNTTSVVATVTVDDTTAPSIRPPADITLSCEDGNIPSSGLTAFLAAVSTAEECSGETVTSQLFSFEPTCGATGIYTYQFTVTDDCGNSAQAFATVTTEDNDAPTSTCPPMLVLECGDPSIDTDVTAWLNSVSGVGADDCEDAIVTNDFTGSLPDGCGASIGVRFTFTDPCGNIDNCQSSISINDTQAPVFVNCPSDMTVNVDAAACDANVIFSTPLAFDDCNTPVTVMQTAGPNSGSTFPLGVSAITFEAMDDCGLLSDPDCEFTITVVDSGTPSIDCPSNITRCADAGRCDWISDGTIDPIANENCTARLISYDITGATTASGNDSASGVLFELGTSTVCYTISDGGGASSMCCFDVLVEDCESPSITCPVDITVECDGGGNMADINAWLPGASSTDNCDTNPAISNLPFNNLSGCGASESIIYEFTATDAAGNMQACLASFTIEDTTDPIIDVDAIDNLVECNPASNQADLVAWLNIFASTSASDDCSTVSFSHDFSILSNDCGDTGMTTVVFTATDECGNQATTSADFVIEDTTDPVITCPVDITLECDDNANDAVVANWLLSGTATDGCGDITISNDFPGVESTTCGITGFSTVTFTVEDACGNSSTCAAEVTIEDTTDPEFLLTPQDMIVECDGAGNTADVAAWLANNAGGQVSDNCDTGVVWNNAIVNTTTDCGSASEAVYLFTVTDACGNTATSTASFITEDTTVPVLTPPTDATFECEEVAGGDLDSWLAQATSTDGCSGAPTITSSLFNTVSACGGGSVETYLFVATDLCGNQATSLATFTLEDSTDPIIACPADLVLSCGSLSNPTLINAWLLTATYTDNCSDVNITNDYNGTLPSNCGGSLTVTFTAEDDCGNIATCSADIIMDDVVTPDFLACPSDITINVDVGNCGSNPIFATPQVVDNCGVTVAQTGGPASGTTFPVGTTSIEFTATDECGNTEVCAYNITVVDSSVPDIDCIENIEVCVNGGCMWLSSDISPNTGNDNCTGYVISYDITGATTASGLDDASGVTFLLGSSEVCYTIEDTSGNTAECCFNINVFDCEPPTITCPIDLVVECDGIGNPADLSAWLTSLSVVDNCNDFVTATFASEIGSISDCGNAQTFIYEFTATDDNNNFAVCSASFTIEDTTAPTITVDASDLVAECDGFGNSNILIAWLNSNGGASADDLCGNVSWTHDFNAGLTPDCGQAGMQTVTFTATDECGNSDVTSANFILEDTTAPSLICPQSIVLECGGEANDIIITNWLAAATGSDDCGNVIVSNDFPSAFVTDCGDAGMRNVTFTSTDDCGNTTDCIRVITIEDTTAPFLSLGATDLILECGSPTIAADLVVWLANNGGATAIDDCDDALVWTNTPLATIDGCGNTEDIPYVFIVTDACGNSSSSIATFRTIDTTDPIITVPADMLVECDGTQNSSELNAWLASVSATDDCGLATTDFVLINLSSNCGSTNAKTFQFTATDECGNQSTAQATFTIEDTSDPMITCPTDLLLECGEADNNQLINAWLNDATTSDLSDCSAVVITHDYIGRLPLPLICNGGAGIIVTFTATDDCGNTATCTATVRMNDTIDPFFVNCHDDVTLPADVNSCERTVLYGTPIALDQCDDMVDVTLTTGLPSGAAFPLGVTTVTYLATDDCGNTMECTFDITIVDGEDPELDCPSTDILKCADANVCTWTADEDVNALTGDQCGIGMLTYAITGATNIASPTTGVNNIGDDAVVFNLGTSVVIYTIIDGAGNTTTCQFEVIVSDCQDPTLTCNDQLNVDCGTEDLSAWMASIEATAMDNCDMGADITFNSLLLTDFTSCGNTFDRVYQFTAIDQAGNSSSCTGRFSTVDGTAPIITPASNVSFECDGTDFSDDLTAWINNNGGSTFTSDNCSNTVTYTNNFIGGLVPNCGSTGSVMVTFTATDECGNSATTTAVFEITDISSPVVNCPSDLSLECSDPDNTNTINAWLLQAGATDQCSPNVTVTNDYPDVFVDECGLSGTFTVTFTATDDCGNFSTCDADIIIIDSVDPLIEIGAQDLVLECGDDNDITIGDWELNQGNAVATDACSNEALVWSIIGQDITSECGNTTTTIYTFQVEDNCGNTSTTQASLIIEDTTPPVLMAPAAVMIECGTETPTTLSDFLGSGTATDECGGATVTSVLWNTVSGCGNTNTTAYLFTATDECGNSSTAFSEYRLMDTQVPTITCPTAELALECGAPNNQSMITLWLNTATASDPDNCSTVSIGNDYPGGLPFPLECNGGAGILVTFTVEDDCGNSSSCISTITMNDTVDPTFVNCPSDLTVSIDSDACDSRVIYPTPNAIDDCEDNPAITFVDGIVSGEVFPIGTTTITFQADDACGNNARCEFDITVEDTDEPSIECPVNDVEVCADADSCSWLSDESTDPAIADNCMGLTLEYDVDFADGTTTSGTGTVSESAIVFPLGTSTINYTLRDDAGNESSCAFEVTVSDCEAPTIICNDLIDVLCGEEDLTSWFNSISSTVTDNCDMFLDLTVSQDIQTDFSSCGNTVDRLYTFTVTDQAGNQSACSGSFRSLDNMTPIITDAVNQTIECSAEDNADDLLAWLNSNGGATFVSDNCSNTVSWTNDFTTALSDECSLTGDVTVVFTATDDCGNSSMTSATFAVVDTTEPVITCPANLTLECGGSENDNAIITWLDRATASDNCDADLNITNDFGTTFTDLCGLTGVHDVIFSVSDACVNFASCMATITLVDTTSPLIEAEPVDLILVCAEVNNAADIAAWESDQGGAVATDACSDDLLVWAIESQTPTGTTCGLTGMTTYVFSVTDNCGNSATVSADVIITDNMNPVLTVPSDQVEECGDITITRAMWINMATATDECGAATVTAQLWNTIVDCGNTSTEQYLFTATDDCGNQSTGFAEYTIEDTEDPIISCPMPLALECGNINNAALISNWLQTAIISEENDCNDVTLSNDYDGSLPLPLSCNNGSGLIITFLATDDCGNTSTCTGTITMDDTVAPAFVNCPADLTVNIDADLCTTNVVYSAPVAIDNCESNPNVNLISGISSGQVFPLGTTTIVFEAEDDCGNTSECEFDITVVDSGIPDIQCPSNDVVVCNDPSVCTWDADAQVNPIIGDNCTGFSLLYEVVGNTSATSSTIGVNTLSGNVTFNLGQSTVTYVIEDGAGNTSSCSFNVIVEDCEAPTITCSDITFDCGAEDVAQWTADIATTGLDNCNTNAELITTSQLITDLSSCGGTFDQVYLFIVTDEAGNSSQCSGIITTTDMTAPAIPTPATDVVLECSASNFAPILIAWLANSGGAVATDACSGPLVWTNDFDGSLNETCGVVGETTVVFTATDDCGNFNTTSARFIIEDNTAPTIICPPDIIVECGETNNNVIISTWLSSAGAVDNCGDVTTTNDYAGLPVCGVTLDVTFAVIGNCDNAVVECVSTVTTEDTQTPVIVRPPLDLFIECDGAGNNAEIQTWLADNIANDATVGMSVVDNCAAVTITAVEVLQTDDCGASTIISYEFTATDDCGNSITEIAQVHIDDTTDPILNLPVAANVVECDADVNAALEAWLSSATIMDICGTGEVNFSLIGISDLCDGTVSQTRYFYQFIATDDCGNQTFGTDNFTVEDNVAPVITAPANLQLVCGDDIGLAVIAWLADFTVVEACQTFQVTNDFDGVVPSTCGGSETVTWTVTDGCGATSSASATIIVADDNTPPIIDFCPADITLTTEFGQCDAVLNHGTPTASDCSHSVTIMKTGGPDIGTMINAGETVTIEFTATDLCGNSSICEFDVTVLDEQLPTIACPSNDIIECNDPGTCAWLSDADVSPANVGDNCGDTFVTYELSGATVATGDIDAAGETFNVGVTTVVYTISDVNGNNAVNCTFDVQINDCEDPTLVCEDIRDVNCGEDDLNAWMAGIENSALDNCSTVIQFDALLLTDVSSCNNTFDRSYLFTVTDEARNTSTCSASYSTVDTTSPDIVDEATDLIIECDGSNNQSIQLIAWLNNNGGATVTDACSADIVWSNNFNGNITPLCGSTSEINVTFTATDDCGNSVDTDAVFRIQDTTPPVISVPGDLVIECNDNLNSFLISVWANNAVATDNCQAVVNVTSDFPGVITETCGETATHLVTFTATDNCDNISSATSQIIIEDNVEPNIDRQAMDLVLECADDFTTEIDTWLMSQGGALASDDCSDEPMVWTNAVLETNLTCGTAGETVYVFTVTDNCGNANTTTASVLVNDTTAPTLTVPTDIVEQCGMVSISLSDWIMTATATDACGDVEIDTLFWNRQDGCGETYTERYLFTATDACGNSSTAFAEYAIVDTQSPEIVCPTDLILECGDPDNSIAILAWLDSVTGTDVNGCSDVVFDSTVPGALPELDCSGVISMPITFTATDACGNTSTCVAGIFVNDTTAPEFVNCPADVTVNVDVDLCGSNPLFSTPVADDACSVEVMQTEGPASGETFDVGDTLIAYEATDACGNTAECTFTVTVIDSDVPMILCPSNRVVVETDPGLCVWASDGRVNPSLSFENCPDQMIEYNITGATVASGTDTAMGELFNLGLSEVCYTITDASGNTSMCCFEVEVQDLELPVIVCPIDTLIVATNEINGVCEAVYEWMNPTPTDNCGIDSTDLVITLSDGTVDTLFNVTDGALQTFSFPAGFNDLTYTVYDINGNSATCSFEVEVLGIKHEKTIARVTQNPDDTYCIEYNIRVYNTGNNVGFYSLEDAPRFDDDFVMLSAEYSSSVQLTTQLPLIDDTQSWSLASNIPLIGFDIHVYTLTTCVSIDLRDPNTPGDGLYTLCDDDSDGALEPGEGLYNETFLDADSDGNIDQRDTVCADIPYVTHVKDFVGIDYDSLTCSYTAQYKITVQNIGGEVGSYDLNDQPFFDDDVVINSVEFTTDAAGHIANPTAQLLPGSGPWILSDDQSINAGDTQCYNLDFNLSINLSNPETVGDEVFAACGSANDFGIPTAGEGLFNQSDLDRSNDGNPEEVEIACGDVEIVDLALTKQLVANQSFGYGDILDFDIQVFNQGNVTLQNIQLNDYLPVGFSFTGVSNDPNWSEVAPGVLVYNSIVTPIVPGDSRIITLSLRLEQTSGGYDLWNNYAEVGYAEDLDGIDRSHEDVDSTPDNDNTNDNNVQPGDFNDDRINGSGVVKDEDEDDHDVAAPSIFDLAIRKTIDASNSVYAYGGNTRFIIEVFNQGNQDADEVTVTDFLPCGLEFDPLSAVNTANGWVLDLANNQAVTVLPDVLEPGTSVQFELDLILMACYTADAWLNEAEISSANDTDPTTIGLPIDIDSELDGINGNDTGGGSDVAGEDNEIDDDGMIDEDDHDIQEVQIFDLAFRKTIDNTGPYDIGDIATFDLVVFNQGSVPAENITLRDFLNTGFNFDASINPNWSQTGSILETIILGELQPTDSIVVQLALEVVVDANPDFSDWVNYAEILSATDASGMTLSDIDSDPGSNAQHETDVVPCSADDNNVLGHGPNCPTCLIQPQDEDDHDPEKISVISQLGDFVWKDLNGNGMQDAGEPGVAGVIVNLLDCNGGLVTSLATDASGAYLFDQVLPGSYIVEFDISGLQEGCDFTLPNVGLDNIDSNADANGRSECITIAAGESNLTIDAGLIPLSSIGNYVWQDLNGDGIQDANEPPVSGIFVELFDRDGNLMGQMTTDADGQYCFTDLFPGDYYLRFGGTTNLGVTTANAGNDDTLDSDVDGSNGLNTTATTTLSPGENDKSWDAGFFSCVQIGELVWLDFNENEVQDPFENGINGMQVDLFRVVNGVGEYVDSQITGSKPGTPSDDGFFKFCAQPGTYYLKFNNPPASLVPVVPNFGGNAQLDSDVTGAFGRGTTDAFTVVSGQDRCDIAAGYYKMGTIGDNVWFDDNNNGLRDSNEQGVPDVVARAFNSAGQLLGQAMTDQNGEYEIDHLGRDSYYVEFDLPNGLASTQANVGGDEQRDSDVDGSNGPHTTSLYSVSPGEHTPNVDAGVVFGVLSVQWLDVAVTNQKSSHEVTWKVSSETNVSHYEIERSLNGISSFVSIGKALARGENGEVVDYIYDDYDVASTGIYYYRIKQVDLDESSDHSIIVSVIRDEIVIGDLVNSIDVYPNPVVDELTLEINVVKIVDDLSVNIYDAKGSLVMANVIFDDNLEIGRKIYKINVGSIAKGVYSMNINIDERIYNKKLIIVE